MFEKGFIRRNRRAAAVGTAIALVLAGGVAYAATEWGNVIQSDGQIYACYEADGTMHVRENDGTANFYTCPEGQKRMAWNQRGRTGPTGPQGAKGAPGPAYFARVGEADSGTVRNTSYPAYTRITTWTTSDGAWLWMPDLDVRKCAVTATPVTNTIGATATRYPYEDPQWILIRTNVGTARAKFPVDVTVACPS